jgi:hypothetical protein
VIPKLVMKDSTAVHVLTMYDAASPIPPAIADGYDVAAGYIGSPGATPHVWTKAEWDSQGTRFRLPIYVPAFFKGAPANPIVDAIEALKGLAAIGAPNGITVALDFETHVDPYYVNAFDRAMTRAGNFTLLYGSTSTLFQNPLPSGGYWPADPTDVGHFYARQHVVATQWTERKTADYDLDLDWILDSVPLWNVKETDMTLDDEVVFSPAVIQQLTDLDPETFGPGKEATVGTILGWTCARVAELVILARKDAAA